jgi:hypothetical protein
MNKFARNWDEAEKKMDDELSRKGGAAADPRFYKPKFNKDGTFSALIRFLPGPGDEVPIVKVFNHNFKGKDNLYFREECPTTINQPCPVCNDNSTHWNAGDQQYARDHGRRQGVIVNVYIINDPQSPECNGKVFLYRAGSTILKKINEKRKPTESQIKTGVQPVKVFDYYVGANFRLEGAVEIQKNGNKQNSYNGSSFDNPSQLGDDDLLGRIDSQLYSLKPFLDVSRFKSFDDLAIALDKVMKGNTINKQSTQQASQLQVQSPTNQIPVNPSVVQQPVSQPQAQSQPVIDPPKVENKAPDSPPFVDNTMNDEDEDTFFNNIRNQQRPK